LQSELQATSSGDLVAFRTLAGDDPNREPTMARWQRVLFVISMVCTIWGCATGPEYTYELEEIESESDSERTVRSASTYEDAYIEVSWTPNPRTIGLKLANATDAPIRIVWDEAAFVMDGAKREVVHRDVDFAARHDPVSPTTVAPRRAVHKEIVPTYSIHRSQDSGGGWIIDPYLPRPSKKREEPVEATFQIVLPVEIEGETKRYTFYFRASEVRGDST
jgi:hypothetical protein